ncbi:cytochrome P450 2B4-like [Mytilus californianus]|uniref:cytochrome P450 2B4-like n=1 Tax=Mytilus californianus TaxID=6549 RepID=UPI0022464427|nr:cytochrome P450 2B4-like [Mytilus californianus]
MIGHILQSVDIFVILTFLIALFVAYILWNNVTRAHYNIPGPTPWPIVGNLPAMAASFFQNKSSRNRSEQFLKLQKKYGDLVCLRFRNSTQVLVFGYTKIHKVLVLNADKTKFRPTNAAVAKKLFPKEAGVAMSNGQEWVDLRRFTMVALKDFGVGKKSLEEKIQEEARFLVELFAKQNKKPFDVSKVFSKATSNIISSIIFGSRFDFNDPVFNRLLGNIEYLFKTNAAAETMIPLPAFLNPFSKIKTIVKNRMEIQEYIRSRIDNERRSFDPNNVRHFLDLYLQQEGKSNTKISENHLFLTIADLYLAGTDTTSVTLKWSMLYMIKYPDVQKKCKDEILEIIGEDREPVVKDKDNLPYVMATLHEIQRIATIVPLAVPHLAVEDIEIDGMTIPKNAVIFPSLMSVHRDPTLWEEPDVFRPERFLQNDKFVKKEGFSAFSMGPRNCLGKQLAESELLLLFVSILQRFDLSKADENDELPTVGTMTGITQQPKNFQMCFLPRH